MNLLVIGHPCFDVIQHPNGEEIQSYGGIYYSVATLANLADAHRSILPIFPIGEMEYDQYIKELSKYPSIDTSGIYPHNGPSNEVRLSYIDTNKRVECSKNIFPPIPFSAVQPVLGRADGILINMVSGFDLKVETLDYIRMAVRDRHVPIHLDVHSLTLGIDQQQRRFRRPLPLWRRWCFMIETVQVNEEEAAGLTPDNLDEGDLAQQLLALGGRGFIVTRGERGVTIYTQERKLVQRHDLAPSPVSKVVDPTGSGDVFGAAFSYRYFHTRDAAGAAAFANEVAGSSVEFPGPAGLDEVRHRYGMKRASEQRELDQPTAKS